MDVAGTLLDDVLDETEELDEVEIVLWLLTVVVDVAGTPLLDEVLNERLLETLELELVAGTLVEAELLLVVGRVKVKLLELVCDVDDPELLLDREEVVGRLREKLLELEDAELLLDREEVVGKVRVKLLELV